MWLLNSPIYKIVLLWQFKLKLREMFLLTYELNYSFAVRRKLSAVGSVCIFYSISYHQILLNVTNWTFKYLRSFSHCLLFLHSVLKVMKKLQLIHVVFSDRRHLNECQYITWNIQPHIYASRQLRVTREPNLNVFGLRKESWSTRRQQHSRRSQPRQGLNPKTFWLWGQFKLCWWNIRDASLFT